MLKEMAQYNIIQTTLQQSNALFLRPSFTSWTFSRDGEGEYECLRDTTYYFTLSSTQQAFLVDVNYHLSKMPGKNCGFYLMKASNRDLHAEKVQLMQRLMCVVCLIPPLFYYCYCFQAKRNFAWSRQFMKKPVTICLANVWISVLNTLCFNFQGTPTRRQLVRENKRQALAEKYQAFANKCFEFTKDEDYVDNFELPF